MTKKITSVSNPLVQEVVQLKKEKKTNLYIVEGFRFFESVYKQKKDSIKHWFIAESFQGHYFYPDIQDRCVVVSESVMSKMSSMTTPPGILAVCTYEYAKGTPKMPCLVCYDVSDPGNLGALFRSAAAFSVKDVVCIGGVDPLNQKVIQASAGTLHLLNLYRMTEADFLKHAKNSEIVAISLSGQPIESIEKKKNRFLVIGNEAHGLPESFIAQCSKTVTIPMNNAVESLNAAIAGSIAMFQLF